MARRGQDAMNLERQKLARQRFRSLIRSVMYNHIWLADEEEQKKISMNASRNIAMLVRPRHKIGVLTLAEKGLIRTPHVLRTIEDRKNLLKLLTKLKCFEKLPPQVRARLIPKVKFAFLQKGRQIMKEGGEPQTVYFILHGEVEAHRNIFDSGTYVDKSELIFTSGDCIGDIEMIERCPRKHTYTATSEVELLVVFEDDFDAILRPVMTKQWYERRAAIISLGYFEHFKEEQMRSANKLSVLKEFDALETIYHEDLGEASYAYFVLSGECMILQSLQLKVLHKRFSKAYELVDLNQIQVVKHSQDHTKENINTDAKDDRSENSVSEATFDEQLYEINKALEDTARKGDKIQTDVSPETEMQSSESIVTEEESSIICEEVEASNNTSGKSFISLRRSKNLSVEGFDKSTSRMEAESEADGDEVNLLKQEYNNETESNKQATENFLSSSRKFGKNLSSRSTSSRTVRIAANEGLNSDRVTFETRFIDVGSLTYGGIFGLGEKIEDRVIMARTKVQCLMLPRYWLFEKEQNPGRIWQRRRFVVETGIPSRIQLFKDFLKTRKWQNYKSDFIASIIDPSSVGNPTHYQDIPMMFHIINPLED